MSKAEMRKKILAFAKKSKEAFSAGQVMKAWGYDYNVAFRNKVYAVCGELERKGILVYIGRRSYALSTAKAKIYPENPWDKARSKTDDQYADNNYRVG